MKLSEFTAALSEVFGPTVGPSLAADMVLPELDFRTCAQALAAGVPPRQVWAALAHEMGVAQEFPHRAPRRGVS